MPDGDAGKTLQLLDLLLKFFATDRRWILGHYRDPGGRYYPVGAVLHLSARHALPREPAMSLLQAALPLELHATS